MDAAIRTVPVGCATRAAIAPDTLRGWFAIAATALIALTAVVLSTRRFAGALVEPLPTGVLIGTGLTAAAVVFTVRSLSRHVAVKWSLSVALVLMAIAVSLPRSSWLGLAVLWLSIIGEETWSWHSKREKPRGQLDLAWRHAAENIAPASPGFPQTLPPVFEESSASPVETAIESAEDWTDSAIIQRLTYRRTEDGSMTIEGWLRADFAAEQRTAYVHAAICPAFSHSPQVEAEPLDGPDCEIHTAQALPWGIRWEVKLDRVAQQPTSVVLGFLAVDSTDS